MKNIVTAVLIAIGFLGSQSFMPFGKLADHDRTSYKAGEIARDFHLKNIDGKMVSLADYSSAKGFIVIFTCNHCPVAKLYESRIESLDEQFAPKGYPVIAINPTAPEFYPDDSFNKMVSRANDRHFSFPYLADENQEITRAYGATNTPHVFVLHRENGNLVVRYVGAIDDNAEDASQVRIRYVADAVNALLAGNPIAVPKTKAIGCGIKMKNS